MNAQPQASALLSPEDKLLAWRSARLSGFDESALVWLAAAPAWTEELARAAKFPTGVFPGLKEFLESAAEKGICQRDPEPKAEELAQQRLRTMMALWVRTDEEDKPNFAALLRAEAEQLTDGPEQRRALREVEITASAGQTGFLGTVNKIFSNEDPGGNDRAASVFQSAIADSWQSGNRALSGRVLEAGARVLGEKIVEWLAPAVTPLAAAAWENGAVRDFFFRTAEQLEPEEGARLYMYTASNLPDAPAPTSRLTQLRGSYKGPDIEIGFNAQYKTPSGENWRRQLQIRAIDSIRAIADPMERAEAFIEAIPALDDRRLQAETAVEADATAQRIEATEQNLRLRASLISYLEDPARSNAMNTILAGVRVLPDASRAVDVIARVARAAAMRQDTVKTAESLARSAGDRVAGAQILLEALPGSPDILQGSVDEVLNSLQPAQCEKVLANLSSEAGHAVGALKTNLVFQTAVGAAEAGRFAAAGRISTFLPQTGRGSPADRILQYAEKLPSSAERLNALGLLAPYLPSRVMGQAWKIAARPQGAAGFNVVETMREQLLRYVTETRGPTFVRTATQTAGQAIRSAVNSGTSAPASTARWAAIAEQAGNAFAASALLTSQIRGSVERGNAGEALELLNLTAPLVRLVGAELEPAMALSRQIVQLAYRKAADERHLRRYLQRAEQNQAFIDLIEGPDDRWALHYLGVGGAGKTMLLRNLTARLAVKNGVPLATTRVDFDHMDPNFPVRKPGALLASLAEELRFRGGPGQESRYLEFESALNDLHGILSAEPPPSDPLHNIRTDAFKGLLAQFAGLLQELPKPVIFILDTCEELAKLEPAGAILPSVEATFEILAGLQKLVPSDRPGATPEQGGGLRVVFAGRRLLAQAGDEIADGSWRWCAKKGSLSERNKLLPAVKDYLRLHLVRGFTEEEVSRFFASVSEVDPGPARRQAILQVSRQDADVLDIEWLDSNRGEADEARYNPFDVSLYGEWVRESPAVTAETIGSGETDPYVRARIVDRILDDGVQNALPAAVLLRRFDVNMLQPVVGDAAERTRVFRELGAQEWIEYQQNVLQIQRNLLERVERFYRHEARLYLLMRAQAALGPGLAGQLRETLATSDPFEGLTVAKIDAALRLLPDDEGARLWDEIDRRVTDTANWSWAAKVCRELLSEQNAAGADDSPLRVAVRATMAAAALHTPDHDPGTLQRWWEEIARKASTHPIVEIGEWLALRAEFGLAGTDNGRPMPRDWRPLPRDWSFKWKVRDRWRWEQVLASAVAAAERTKQWDGIRWPDELPGEISAFVAGSSSGDGTARVLAAAVGPGPTLQRWADWRAPVSVRDRVRLQIAQAQSHEFSGPELHEWSNDAAATLKNIDSERLLAQLLQIQLNFEVPGIPSIGAGGAIYDTERKPECDAHRRAPVLFAVMAEVRLSEGDAVAAEELLRTRVSLQDSRAVNERQRVEGLLNRRMRRPDSLEKLADSLPREIPNSTEFHWWWVRQTAHDTAQVMTLVEAAERRLPEGWRRQDGTTDAHTALDAVELDLLGKRLGRETDYATPLIEEASKSDFEDFRVQVRRRALKPAVWDVPELPGAPLPAAEIMLEEAELLALRFPDLAQILFLDADRLFSTAGSKFGEFRCMLGRKYHDMADAKRKEREEIAAAVGGAWERWRARLPQLPEWSSTNIARPGSAWEGWLVRIERLQASAAEPDGGPATEASKAHIHRYCGAAAQFELGMLDSDPPAGKAKQSRFSWEWVAVVLAGAGVGLWALKAQLNWLQNGEFLSAVAILAGYSVGIFWFTRWLIAQLFQSLRPVLRIETAGERKITMMLQWFPTDNSERILRRVIGRLSTERLLEPRVKIVAMPGNGAYRPPGDWAPNLRNASLVRRLGLALSPALPLRVMVDRQLSRHPWEAWLNLEAGWRWLRFGEGEALKIVRPGLEAIRSMTREGMKGVDVYCRSGLAPVLETAWEAKGRAVRISPSRRGAGHALHAVGTVRRTASGTRFLAGKGGGTEDNSVWGLDFFGVYPIVVLQEDPAERVRRLDVDRERTADMREWAQASLEAGAQAVLLMPSMPLALAGAVTRKMASRLRRGWEAGDMRASLDLVSEIQRVIRNYEASAAINSADNPGAGMSAAEKKAALRELALEVTIFNRLPETDPANGFSRPDPKAYPV